MSIEAVVMAAGEGTRLRPLTDRWPKPVLPIDGRPVIATLLRELAAARPTRVTVVTGHLAEQIEALVGDGSGFGLEVRYARQPVADGSADAVVRALAAGASPPLLVATADTWFAPGDVARFADAFEASGAVAAVAVRRHPPPGPERAGVLVDDGLVRSVADRSAAADVAHAALWAFGLELATFLDGLPGPPFELALAFQRAVDAGHAIRAVEIGNTRDLTRPLDLVQENFPYLKAIT